MAKKKSPTSSSRISRASRASTIEDYVKQMLRERGLTDESIQRYQQFTALNGAAKNAESRKIIQDCVIDATSDPDDRLALAVAESESLLEGYATLDEPHRSEISKLIGEINGYLKDPTRQRPLNALMLASPGAGKSFFIKRLAHKMRPERVQAVTFNMATMQSADDMAQPIDELRNLKVNDRFPLLFLDEFDSDPSRYAALLPLLWEGELHIGHRDLKLGKSVIILAGSNPNLPKAMDRSAKMRVETDSDGAGPTGKLVDLLSRINGGVINIPDLDLRTTNRDRRVDKVCAAISLAKARFGDDLLEMPRALLRFISQTQFRYGTRSIAHLIDVIDGRAYSNKKIALDSLDLPLASEQRLIESSLKFHMIDKDQGFGIVNRWKNYVEDKTVLKLRSDLDPLFMQWARFR